MTLGQYNPIFIRYRNMKISLEQFVVIVFVYAVYKEVEGISSDGIIETTSGDRNTTKIENAEKCISICSRVIDSEKLLFHQNGTKNAVVSNNGTLAFKESEGYSAVITNRHLKKDELFQVKFEQKSETGNEILYFMAIGVTTYSSSELNSTNIILPREWMMQWYIPADNQTDINLQKFLQHGIVMGVQRRDNGSLEIYVNGVNEGSIAENVADSVYGAIEFLSEGLKASIVD